MAQAGSPQGLRLPVSGRGQGSGIFSVGEAESSVRGFFWSGKPSLLLDNTGGAVFPHPAEFFFMMMIHNFPIREKNY